MLDFAPIASFSSAAWVSLFPTSVLMVFAFTYAITTINYHLTLRRNAITSTNYIRPPVVPYCIPWVGSALSFLTPVPGWFYDSIFTFHNRRLGYFGAILGGQVNHIVYSPNAVQALFRLKPKVSHREHLTKMMLTKSFNMSNEDYEKTIVPEGSCPAIESGYRARKMEPFFNEYLLKKSAVDELTSIYMGFLKTRLAEDTKAERTVDLYKWLQRHMFRSGVKAFLGERMEDLYDGFEKDFWQLDGRVLDLSIGVMRLFRSEPYRRRDRLVNHITRWIEEGDALASYSTDMKMDNSGVRKVGPELPDPYKPPQPWEPVWGSRFQRARQALWIKEGLTSRGRASSDLGFLFGVNTNVLPATGWMMMHILDPTHPDILPRVLVEVEKAVQKNGDRVEDIELDINVLLTQPLLQALYQEVLRLYVDNLVARQTEEDISLPLEENRMLHIKKGETVIAANFISHRDPEFFHSPPEDVFDPARFLVPATATDGEDKDAYVFSTAATAHKLWPYGGGHTTCTGRVFAKQEMLVTVAILLLAYDFSPANPEKYKIPGLGKVYGGSGTIPPHGDVEVHIHPRKQTRPQSQQLSASAAITTSSDSADDHSRAVSQAASFSGVFSYLKYHLHYFV